MSHKKWLRMTFKGKMFALVLKNTIASAHKVHDKKPWWTCSVLEYINYIKCEKKDKMKVIVKIVKIIMKLLVQIFFNLLCTIISLVMLFGLICVSNNQMDLTHNCKSKALIFKGWMYICSWSQIYSKWPISYILRFNNITSSPH